MFANVIIHVVDAQPSVNQLRLMTWNVRGWTNDNKQLRTNVIIGENPDITVVVETHLTGEDKVDIDGYHGISHNRQFRHIRANRNFGGVGILVKNCVFQVYDVVTVDKSVDGLLAANFLTN